MEGLGWDRETVSTLVASPWSSPSPRMPVLLPNANTESLYIRTCFAVKALFFQVPGRLEMPGHECLQETERKKWTESYWVIVQLKWSIVVQLLSCVWLFMAHGLQHVRPLCPSPSLRVCSNSCPLSWWHYPTMSSSVVPSSLAFNLSQHQGLFQWVGSSHQVVKVLELWLQHQSFQWIVKINCL